MEAAPVKWTFQLGEFPRSGSAWLASLLNMHEGVFCFHDALQSFDGKYDDAPASVADYPHRGDASSYNCMLPVGERAAFVYRCPVECFQSMKSVGLSENWHQIYETCLAWSQKVPIFTFPDIFREEEELSFAALHAMFEVIVPGVEFKPEKARMLRPLRVELLRLGPDVFDIEKIRWRMN